MSGATERGRHRVWNCESRQRHDRRGLRYPSDLSDAEWALIAPMIPPAKRGGRRRTVDLRSVVEGLLYLLETGCQWRHLPKDFPPRSTVWAYFDLWSYDGTLARIHEARLLWRCARRRGARPARAPRSSTARRSNRPKKGGLPGGNRL